MPKRKQHDKIPAGTALPQAPAESSRVPSGAGDSPEGKEAMHLNDERLRRLSSEAKVEDAKLIRTEQAGERPRSLSLYQIENELDELLQLREDAEGEGMLPDEVAAIDKQIAEYVHRELKKVDGIAHAIHTYEEAGKAAQGEADRLKRRQVALERRVKRIKDATIGVMQQHGIKRLETATNVLRIQANGGLQPLEVASDREITGFHDVSVTLPMLAFDLIRAQLDEDSNRMIESARRTYAINGDRARAALAEKVVCQACPGPECEKCGGSGMVPRTIPGVKLLPRGVHLRVE